MKSLRARFLLGVGILVLANIGFSSKAVIIKLMYRYDVDTYSVIALRMFFSLPFYVAIAWWLNQREKNIKLTTREWLSVSGLGILSYYISSTLDFLGLQYVTAGMERLTLYLYPTIVLILSAVFFKKKITPPQYLAIGLTYLGILLAFVAEHGVGEQKNAWLGSALVFSAACTYSVYVVLTGEYVHKIGSAKFTCYAMIAATVPALIQSARHNGMDIFNYPMPVYGLTAYMVLVATVIPTFMIVEGIRLVGANNSGIIGAVGPVSMIGLAYIFLGEQISALQLLGTAIVLVGVLLITWKGKKT